MLDLNDLRIFERVGELRSFSGAARDLGIPKSSVSRGVQRLETELGVRLLQRTTRETVPTSAGVALLAHCAAMMRQVNSAVDHVGEFAADPRGTLRIAAGIGAGPNILAEILPGFLREYPRIRLCVDLSSQIHDLIGDNIDVAIRMGPLPESSIVKAKLGQMQGYLCASPEYLARKGVPLMPGDLAEHDTIAMAVAGGRPRPWTFRRDDEIVRLDLHHKLEINCAVSIHRMVLKGAGIGSVAGYMSGPGFEAGTLVRLLPDYSTPPIEVHAVFPSRRELSASVRAFIDYVKRQSVPGMAWQRDPVMKLSV